jgi:hypothetical protein
LIFQPAFKSILEKILVVRPPESKELDNVVQYIKKFLEELKAGLIFLSPSSKHC